MIAKFFGLRQDFKLFFGGSLVVLQSVVMGKALSLVWKIVLARLGPEALGQTQVVLTLLTFLSSFALLGLPIALTRFIAIAHQLQQPEKIQRLFLSVLKWSVGLGILLAGVSLWAVPWLQTAFGLKLVSAPIDRLIILAVPFVVASEIVSSYFNAVKRITWYARIKFLLPPLFRLLLLGICIWWGWSAPTTIVAHLLGAAVLTSLVAFFISRVSLTQVLMAMQKLPAEFIRYSLPVSGSFLFFVVYGSIDVFLINQYLNVTTVGLYSILVLLSELTDIFFLPFLNLLQTFLGKYHRQKKNGALFIIMTCWLLLIGGSGIGLVLFLAKDFLIEHVFGSVYAPALYLVGFILVQKIIESSLVMPLRHFLDFYGYVRQTMVLMGVMMVIKAIISWYGVVHFGFAGVLAAQVVIQILHAAGCGLLIGWLFRRQLTLTTAE